MGQTRIFVPRSSGWRPALRGRTGRIAFPIAAGGLQGRKILAGGKRVPKKMTGDNPNIAFRWAVQPPSRTIRDVRIPASANENYSRSMN